MSIGILGDVDEDGEITSNDAMIVLRYSIGLEEYEEMLLRLADVNGDEDVTSDDALLILRCSVELPSYEPLEIF